MTLVEPRSRRPRRIAADEAHAWARNLRLGNPYAKLVLSMLTIYVNGDGICFVGIDQLAEDTELSIDTVRRRLAWLEQAGAIARFPQWIDGNGKRNGEARGKRTSDEIRLLLNADADDIEARARGNGDGPEGHEAEISPSPQPGLNSEPETTGPAPALGQPSHCGKGPDSSNQEPEDSPPTPPRGGDEQHSNQVCEGWNEFKAEFEADGEPIVRVSLAEDLFSALAPDERKRLTKAAKGLIVWRSKQKKPSAKPSAQTFIREVGAWASWIAHAPPDPKPPAEKVLVLPRSDAWCGLWVIKRIWDSDLPEDAINVERAALPALHSLARLFDQTEPWLTLIEVEHRPQVAAWRERLAKCGYRMPRPQRIDTGKVHPTLGAVKVDGWFLPAQWPPHMDGTLSATGPPSEVLMTEDDKEALADLK